MTQGHSTVFKKAKSQSLEHALKSHFDIYDNV